MFTGDYIWNEMFGTHFDQVHAYPSFNVRDLDTLDRLASDDLLRETK